MEVEGLEETMGAIRNVLQGIEKPAKSAVKLAGQEYANDVKAQAPYKTGTYRRSIHVQMIAEDGKDYALVGTDLPYARRLEYGFFDMVDRLGRHYYQYPRPHFRPALDTQIGKYTAIMKGEIAQWLESADLAGRSGLIYAAGSMPASSASSGGARSRLNDIGGTMRGDFGGWAEE